MHIQGVITGDIVDSTKVESNKRTELLLALKETIADINQYIGLVKIEIYRGDSFQIIIPDSVNALRIAILIRLGLQRKTPNENIRSQKWDARISLGIGDISFSAPSIPESDGEAFRNSGRAFDKLGKNYHLIISTPWSEINNELEVSTKFADILINSWSYLQIEVIYHSLLIRMTQKELAKRLNLSPQTLNKRIVNAKVEAIEKYIARFEQIIKGKDGIE
ncbi:winged helix-turn-helix transcriptional regulator [uncultured Bacteroides sp.]|uniref:winged helix-turn-helix transcriptional regulator n=1 Tax=uncultured Bacteroides sp. TaxID=162156 RepID=UPI002AAC1E30|nr:winged helix-turn-helix transcriptional regulator [uncultured Bacteroides sp.]